MDDKEKSLMLNFIENQDVRADIRHDYKYSDSLEINETVELMISEGGEDLFNYVDWMGLANSPNLILLSSQKNYYYAKEELKNFSTIVNLKQLEQIKNINDLMKSISGIMQPNSHFIGYFAENKDHPKNQPDITSSSGKSGAGSKSLLNSLDLKKPFVDIIFNLSKLKNNRNYTRRDVYKIFEKHGFRILDVTEVNDLTYFYAKKIQVAIE
jgi:hypothetical protein